MLKKIQKCWICNEYLTYSKTISETQDDEFYECTNYNKHNFTYITYTYGGKPQQKILCRKEVGGVDIQIDYHYNKEKKGDMLIYISKIDEYDRTESKRLYAELNKTTMLKIFNDVDYLNFLETYS